MKIMIARPLTYILMTISTLLLASNSSASTWYVGTNGNDSAAGSKTSPFATIQKAIGSATNGDVINVLPGTYQGSGNRAITLSGKQITLQSLSGPSNTIIDLQGNYAINADSSISNSTVIDGFTFKNGYYSTSTDWRSEGIITIHNGLTVNNCVFYSNSVVATYATTGTAIIAQNWVPDSQQSPIINNCLFYSNSIGGGANLGWAWGRASVIGSGASSQATSVNISVQNCTIANNRLYTAASGPTGLLIPLNAGKIVNCITWSNTPAFDPPHPSVTAQTWSVQSQTYSISQNGYNSSYNSNIITVSALSNNPLFVNATLGNYSLKPNSPAKNTGDPTSSLNLDGTRADMGYRSDLANIRSYVAPILVYSLKGSQFTAVPSGKTTLPWTGYALSDDSIQTSFIITYSQAGTNFFSIYSSTNTDVQSTGYWVGSFKLYSEALTNGVFPNVEKEVVWITGTNALVPLSASKSIIAPKTLSAIDNLLTLQGGTMIVNQSGTLTIDTTNTLMAITNNEAIDQTISRLSNSLNQQGYRYQQQ